MTKIIVKTSDGEVHTFVDTPAIKPQLHFGFDKELHAIRVIVDAEKTETCFPLERVIWSKITIDK